MIDMKIKTQLKLSIAGILLLVAVLAALSWTQTDRLWRQTQVLYDHPLEVRRAIGNLKSDILVIHWGMEELFAHYTPGSMQRLLPLIKAHEASARAQFDILLDRYSGDRADIELLYQTVEECRANREQVISLMQAGDIDRAQAINIHSESGPDTPHLRRVMELLQNVDDSSHTFAEQYYNNASDHYRAMVWQMIAAVSAIILLSAAVGLLLYRRINFPLRELTALTDKFRQGDFTVRSHNESGNEIGLLAGSFNQMAGTISHEMQMRAINEQISETLLNANDITEFRKNLLRQLVDLTDSQMGAYFRRYDGDSVFEPFTSIGLDHKMLQPFDASTLEGQLGKIVSTGRMTLLRDIPQDSVFHFRTFAGTLHPREMISFPVILDNVVRGVICLASIKPYTRTAIDIMNQPWSKLVHTVFANLMASEQTRQLSEELAENNQELKAQQEELQAQGTELLKQTEELQAQNEELEQQRLAVEEATRLKSQFLSNMSHELRTPLNSVMALSRVLMMQAGDKLSEEESGYLEIIQRNGKNLLALINDILDLSKIEAGRMDLNPRSFALGHTLENIVESILPLAREKQIELIHEIPSDIPAIESDEIRVSQILQNLISNAVKFTDSGTVSVSVHTDQEKIFVRVEDTGIGIEESDLPYIFDEFRQVDGSSARRHEGTGLGLTIAHKAARMLGGDLSAESTPGEGSAFTLELPLIWKGRPYTHETVELSAPSVLKPKQKTILVVDDEPEMAKMITGYLEQEGYNTVAATSGKQALQVAARMQPFAITLDILMPEMDGWEVLQGLKSSPATRDIPVIVVSVTEDRETGFALGAVGSVTKPVSKERLVSEIRRIGEPQASTVMIVDDDDLERREMIRMVEEAGLKPVVAEDGEVCLRLLKQQIPDILILDLMMPKVDGFTVLERIRAAPETSDLPVIVVSAKDLTSEDRKRLKGNISSILAKNASAPEALFKELKSVLAKLENEAQMPEVSKASSPARILLVEDNEAAIIQVRSVLESAGYAVDVAKGGQEAISYMARTTPDAIILDLMMPHVDGFEVLETIRGKPATANLPVLVLTAKDLTAQDFSRLSANNIQQLVQKGDVDRKSLLSKVGTMVHGKNDTKRLDANHFKQETPKTDTGKMDGQPATILIVEDNPDNMTTIKAVLQNRYRILEATNGETGLRMVEEYHPDLVLLDMALPGMDGITVVRRLKDSRELGSIPVIAMTAKVMKGDREEILEAGCHDYIAKPIDPEACLETINKWIQA